ncbi:MAG TPA: hypothetical protein DCQ64_18130 [Candidatus Rokubacteria bacterium]|nr:hypothetical protein [Candidatus Rokubacteria bacterium]
MPKLNGPAAENLILDPRLVHSTGGWWDEVFYSEDYGGAPAPSIVADTGFNWQRLTYTGQAGDTGKMAAWYSRDYAGTPGETATIALEVKGTLTNGGCSLAIFAYNGVTELDNTTVAVAPAVAAAVHSATLLLPATTTRVVWQVIVNGSTDAVAFDLSFGKPILTKTEDVVPWFCGASDGCAWSGTADASSSTRPANVLSYRRRFTHWAQGTIAGRFVPVWDPTSGAWAAPPFETLINLGKSEYAGNGVGIFFYADGNPLMLMEDIYTVGHDWTTVATDWLPGSVNVFVATWENLVGHNLWLNGIVDAADQAMDLAVWPGSSLVHVGMGLGGYGWFPGYLGPFIVSEEVKSAGWRQQIMARTGAAFLDPDRLFRDFCSDGDLLIPLATDTAAAMKGRNPYLDPLDGDYLLACDGNSLTYGYGATPGVDAYPDVVMASLPGSWDLLRPKISGDSTGGLIAKAPTWIDPFLARTKPYAKTILVFMEGTNNMNGATTPAEELAYWHTYCDARRAAGWDKIVVMTVLPASVAQRGAGWEAKRTDFNALLRAGYTDFADVLVDIGAHAVIGLEATTADGTYYVDGLHLTAAGYAIVGGMVEPVIETFL